jgi:CBS domain-containing protein
VEVGPICERPVLTTRRFEAVARAARLMRENQAGYVVVIELDPYARPVGVLTGSDIAIRVVAPGLDPKQVSIGGVMTIDPITVIESDSVEAALQKMREFGVRRLPVVNERRELVGILAIDDVLQAVGAGPREVIAALSSEWQIEGATPL